MATIIQVKRTTTANLPSQLEQGELAYIYDTSATDTDAGGNGGRLYIGDPTTNTNTPLKIGGKYYTDLMDHTHGTLTASAAVIVDSSSKIDVWNVDNLTLDGNTLSSTDTNGNINVTPNGTGKSIITNMYVDATTSLQEYIQDQTGGAVVAGEGIDVAYDDSAGTTTISGEDATTSNKGIASFDSGDFGVTSGAVTLSDDVVKTITTDSGALTPSSHGLSVLGGEGMDVTHTGTTITVAGEDATTSNKGVASFNSSNFSVSSGAVSLASGGVANGDLANSAITVSDGSNSNAVDLGDTLSILGGTGLTSTHAADQITLAIDSTVATLTGTQTLTNKTIDASSNTLSNIANASLTNSSITIGSDTVSLGATQTDLNGITSLDVDNVTIDGNIVSTTDTNGDLSLEPNGTGTVIVPSGYESRAGFQSQSLVNKAYVDQVANGLDVKASVRVATTANLSATYNNSNGTLTATANGAIAIDGVTLSANDRVLVKDQTDPIENGFYKVTNTGGASAAFVLTRTPDANEASEITGGAFTFVEEGTNNADNGYVATHNGTPTLGTDDITFDQFSGAGQISAGDALTKTGNTIDVNVDDSSIEIASDALQVKALGITNAMLAGSIANAKLTNSTITMSGDSGSNAVDLGDTFTFTGGSGITSTVSGDVVTHAVNVDDSSIEISGDSLQVKALGITNAMLAGSIANAKLVNDSVTINSNTVALGASITLDTDDIGEGSTNLYYQDERVYDAVAAMIGNGTQTNITVSSTDGTDDLTFSVATATTSVKGVASFSSDNFTVTSGAVTVTGIDGGTY